MIAVHSVAVIPCDQHTKASFTCCGSKATSILVAPVPTRSSPHSDAHDSRPQNFSRLYCSGSLDRARARCRVGARALDHNQVMQPTKAHTVSPPAPAVVPPDSHPAWIRILFGSAYASPILVAPLPIGPSPHSDADLRAPQDFSGLSWRGSGCSRRSGRFSCAFVIGRFSWGCLVCSRSSMRFSHDQIIHVVSADLVGVCRAIIPTNSHPPW